MSCRNLKLNERKNSRLVDMWVEGLIEHAVKNGWCLTMRCSTCSACEFRDALKARLSPAYAVSFPKRIAEDTFAADTKMTLYSAGNLVVTGTATEKDLALTTDEALIIIEELKHLEEKHIKYRQGIMLLLFLSWHTIGEEKSVQIMPESLQDSMAGTILNMMIAHYRRANPWQLEYDSLNSPEAIAERKDRNKSEKQRLHSARLECKKMRDLQLIDVREKYFKTKQHQFITDWRTGNLPFPQNLIQSEHLARFKSEVSTLKLRGINELFNQIPRKAPSHLKNFKMQLDDHRMELKQSHKRSLMIKKTIIGLGIFISIFWVFN